MKSLRQARLPSFQSSLFSSNTCIQIASFILLLCFLALQAAAQVSDSSEQKNTLSGTVINSVTHEPIPRALVYSADNRYAMLTDSEGHFEFETPKPKGESQSSIGSDTFADSFVVSRIVRPYRLGANVLWLSARKPGFLNEPSDERPSPASDGQITIALVPEALIIGRVTLSTGDSASGLFVQLYSKQVIDGMPQWFPGRAARANSAGEFRFTELQAGSYKIVTHEYSDDEAGMQVPGRQHYGYPPVYYPAAADLASAGTIQVSAGQTVEANLELTRQAYFNVKIPVANAASVPGLDIRVEGQRGPGYSLGYNATDQRIEGQLPNGSYDIDAISYGTPSSTGKVSLRVAGAPTEGPTLTLLPNGSVTLNVTEAFANTTWDQKGGWSVDGKTFPIHGPRLYLTASAENADNTQRPGSGGFRPPTGENDGSLVIDNLTPGRYWLRLNTSRGYIASATMGGADLLHQPFTIGPGQNLTVDVTMRDDGASVDGTVTDLANQAVAGSSNTATENFKSRAWVYWVPLPDSTGHFQDINVSNDGKFTIPMIAPGTYRVFAFAGRQRDLPYRDPDAMKAYESKGQIVTLAAGQKATVQLQLIPGND